MTHTGFGVSPTSQASKMTVFRFQENGHFLHMAHKCPACRLRQSGIVRTNALLAGIWNSCGSSGCPDRCPACRDLSRTRNHAAVYTDAQLAGNGKQHLDIRMPSLPVTESSVWISGCIACRDWQAIVFSTLREEIFREMAPFVAAHSVRHK